MINDAQSFLCKLLCRALKAESRKDLFAIHREWQATHYEFTAYEIGIVEDFFDEFAKTFFPGGVEA